MSKREAFERSYAQLNKRQREAVDTIEGPVMVIAGPGTGKTQVLTLRIANILLTTDTPASGVLALTFTNSGVRAMRERLSTLIGAAAAHVTVATFHSFGLSLLDEFYEELALAAPPRILDEHGQVLLFDELLEGHDWKHLRPRLGGAHNFDDLKSLASFLKQERLSPERFTALLTTEIRGARKSAPRRAEKEKLLRLARTSEAAAFFALYERTKRERGRCDYDDILEYSVALARLRTVRDTLRERYLYVLVDEHQDSSGVQNDFLKAVWSSVEKPNVFAVGDDRQLIYGFGGAKVFHFEEFRDVFSGTRVIALTENYRSAQRILDAAETLLQSTMVKEPLRAVRRHRAEAALVLAEYPRDEILAAAQAFTRFIRAGRAPEECALLVPKRAQVRSAVAILRERGLPVAGGNKVSLFSLPEAQTLLKLFRLLLAPLERVHLAAVLLDPAFGVPPLAAHAFLKEHARSLSLLGLEKETGGLRALGKRLTDFLHYAHSHGVYELAQHLGMELFFREGEDHAALVRRIEVVRTFLHLALARMEQRKTLTLSDFVAYLGRLEAYGEEVPVALFSGDAGVRVETLHASKGLEFDFVWIAHLDEASLMRGRRLGFTLPAALKERQAKKDELTARRELYVGLTRARRRLTLSYAKKALSGAELQPAKVLAELRERLPIQTAGETERTLRSENSLLYVSRTPGAAASTDETMAALVRERFAERPLAVTHLNNFFGCPWRWYFRNFLELPEPKTESLKFGSIVHRVLERLLSEPRPPQKKLRSLLETALDALRIVGERERRRLARDARAVLSMFFKRHLPRFKGARAEVKLTLRDSEFPDIELTGKIDAVRETGQGSVSVTDFKTGGVKTKGEIEKRDNGRLSDPMRQLAMYAYLLAHQRKPLRVSSAELLFLETREGDTNASYTTGITDEHLTLLRRDIREFVAQVKSGEWMRQPCRWKPFGRQKECPYCALRATLR